MTAFPRVIPVLTISDGYLVKPVKFGRSKYIGDPINAVKIFNEKRVDELFICDIDASVKGRPIDYGLIEEIATEAFMPVGYGGGIAAVSEAERIVGLGIEKVVLGSAMARRPDLVSEVSQSLGSSSTVVSVDFRKRLTGYDTVAVHGTTSLGIGPVDLARRAEALGAGEILLSSVDRESTFSGYDVKQIAAVAAAVDIPVVALGGARGMDDFREGLAAGASGVAAGGAFVLNGKHRAVLITYPSVAEVESLRAPADAR
ncbi:HisA/HisF-related TIM barrel protein [Microbacterium sp. NPDC055910]|uniref:HisA/HisF-related TIM barrel protein n=1 Tax=Microbacterium sp. NPDC055910 TaxID=3345659 RepID=UPI0035E2185A